MTTEATVQQEYTTDEAFSKLITTDEFWKLTGLPSKRRSYFRKRLESGAKITPAKKEELLRLAGFKVIQEEEWYDPLD